MERCRSALCVIAHLLVHSVQRQRLPRPEKPPKTSCVVNTSVKLCLSYRLPVAHALALCLSPLPLTALKRDGKID